MVEEGRGGNAAISYHLPAPACQVSSKPLSGTLTAYLQGAALLNTEKGNSESWLPRVGGK